MTVLGTFLGIFYGTNYLDIGMSIYIQDMSLLIILPLAMDIWPTFSKYQYIVIDYLALDCKITREDQ